MKKDKKNYFGEREENAVLRYIKTKSTEEKHDIYNKILKKPFDIMVSSILRTYPNYIGNNDIYEVEAEGLSHLIENMIKFRPFIIEYRSKNSNEDDKWYKHRKFKYLEKSEVNEKISELNKNDDEYEYRTFLASAYSYCGTIVRNFFRDKSKITRKEILTNINIEGAGINFEDDEIFGYYENYFDEGDPVLHVFENIIVEIDKILENDFSLTKNEIIVGYAIRELMGNWEKLFLEYTNEGEYDKKISNSFNKNKIMFLLKELTRMNIKDIRLNMKPFKNVYLELKNSFQME